MVTASKYKQETFPYQSRLLVRLQMYYQQMMVNHLTGQLEEQNNFVVAVAVAYHYEDLVVV